MKNIHIIPTDKPSRLLKTIPKSNLILSKSITSGSHWENLHIYITSDEEIKVNDYITDGYFVWKWKDDSSLLGRKKVIITTDQDLIEDGVQAITNTFAEWFVKNPSCESVDIGEGVRYEDEWIDNEDGGEIFQHQYCCYKIIIPKEENSIEAKQRAKNYMSLKGALEQEQETLEEASWKFNPLKKLDGEFLRAAFIKGAKWQAERMYSEEEVLKLLINFSDDRTFLKKYVAIQWFEQFKKK